MNSPKVEEEKNWYAVFTKPRSEKKVYQRMIDQDIDATVAV